jgi:hypothetical protein
MRRIPAEAALLLLTATVFAVGVLWLRSLSAEGLVAYDFYGQFYPYIVHALRSLRNDGGLLWNPYQDCGQPFFGNSQTGLLYPLNVVFAVLPREPALLLSVVIHLTIAGVGMFNLCRSIGLSRPAALCGALAFQLGFTTTNLAAWSPTHMAPFAWLPVALWRTERLVQTPTLRGGLLLGLILAIQLLPGFPQTVFFTYQLIGWRVLCALVLRQSANARALLVAVAVAVLAPLLLDGIQLLPSIEVARESVRRGALTDAQLGSGFSWDFLRQSIVAQASVAGNGLMLLLALYGALSGWRRSAQVPYYALLGLGYFLLSLGPGSILWDIYVRVPGGSMFRNSGRLLWIVSVAVAVLAAFGAEELFDTEAHRTSRRRLRRAAILLAGAVAVYAASALQLRWTDLLMMAVPAGLAFAPASPRVLRLTPLLLAAVMVFDLLAVGRPPLFGLRRGDVYGQHADVYEFVRARQTAQDRVLVVGGQPALELMAKSGMLFGVSNIHDYEPLASHRYAEYFTFLRTGRAMRDFDDWYWIFNTLLPPTLQRPLFDLTAARYVIVARALDTTQRALPNGLRPLLDRDGVRVYENEQAIPRARFVGRVVARGPGAVLSSLADASVDARSTAVIGDADRERLHQTGGGGTGTVEFVTDEPEAIVLRVHATTPGFVLLADEYFPGWTATVNAEAREIVRANHTFRLVEVPAGDSEVRFTYRPLSLRIGALVSLIGIAAFVWLWRSSG